MRLKVLTTTFLLFGIGMILSWPWIVGAKPVVGPENQAELRAYATKILVYMTVILVSFLVTLFCAYLLIRQNRREYRQQAMENLQNLLEGTLQDHDKSQS